MRILHIVIDVCVYYIQLYTYAYTTYSYRHMRILHIVKDICVYYI